MAPLSLKLIFFKLEIERSQLKELDSDEQLEKSLKFQAISHLKLT